MKTKFYGQQLLKAIILLSFSLLLLRWHVTGEILKFVNPKYEILSLGAAILFALLFVIQLTRIWTMSPSTHQHDHDHNHHDHSCHDDHCHHDHGTSDFSMRKLAGYSIILFPLLTGFLLPVKTLDSSIASKKGGMLLLSGTDQPASKQIQQDPLPAAELEHLVEEDLLDSHPTDSPAEHAPDEQIFENEMSKDQYKQLLQHMENTKSLELQNNIFSTYYDHIREHPERFKGKTIHLSGFVYKEKDLASNQLVLSRFLITHCIADATLIGFLSELPEGQILEEDTWIQADGVLDTIVHNEQELPYIRITNVKTVPAPDQPYLYPISIRIL
ncbi:TIGR03943 family protein [Paenibacillus sp. Marseille-Q4541]|uniref:TIGR03943 family putative permease subunit n=1 Tax=Paenibacillus sp. Marseille-Q4541 TaxID=2831522 RepID=UPI001BAA9CB0|nr:TIGR03943 family protein [Paenibacillus sp. Marseille-Q4541]